LRQTGFAELEIALDETDITRTLLAKEIYLERLPKRDRSSTIKTPQE
jgi:hypothetical protein